MLMLRRFQFSFEILTKQTFFLIYKNIDFYEKFIITNITYVFCISRYA